MVCEHTHTHSLSYLQSVITSRTTPVQSLFQKKPSRQPRGKKILILLLLRIKKTDRV